MKELSLIELELDELREFLGLPVKGNHIRVVLDFIPVGERLPEPYRVVCVLCKNGEVSRAHRTPHNIVNDEYTLGSWFDASNGATRPVLLFATHWAEIPQVNDAS